MMNKIYATIHSIADEAKGTSYVVRRLYEEMTNHGHQVTLVDADYQAEISCPQFSQSFAAGVGPAKLGRSPLMANYLNQQAKAGEIKLLHNHGLWMMPNVYPGWVARKYNIPLITSPHGTFAKAAWESGSKIKRLFWPLLQRPALMPTVCFHATAESEYLDIRRMGYTQPVAIIPNGIDIPKGFSKQSSSLKTVLFLGRIHPIKGLDMLLEAWHQLESDFPDWQLKIIGPDNVGHLADLQALQRKFNLQRVIFGGAVYEQQKWQEYHNADVFVLPSYSENFAMSVAEALACGVPAVVSKGAPWEELETHNAGLWVEIDNLSLGIGLRELMQKPAVELTQMGQNGKQLMCDKYSWQKVANMMAELYSWVLNGGSTLEFVRLD
ncbi:MAG: glycosyltransferase [Burkholderiales bacterium]|nr:glycosyltransferase [Burkholderiales bacterium]